MKSDDINDYTRRANVDLNSYFVRNKCSGAYYNDKIIYTYVTI